MAVKTQKIWKNGYYTKAALTWEIKQVIAKKHNLDPSDIIVNWICGWKLTKYPTGLIAKVGMIKLWASKFRSKTFIVHQNANEKWYMRQTGRIMATYTKEQIKLVNQIRDLQQKNQEGILDDEHNVYFGWLQEQANEQNLCWW